MFVGALRIEIYIPDCQSLKAKRSVVRKLIQRIKSKYNVSIAEIDNHDIWQRATVAISHVSTSENLTRELLSRVLENAIEHTHEAEVIEHDLSVFELDRGVV